MSPQFSGYHAGRRVANDAALEDDMRYTEFREAIVSELAGRAGGMTWVELRDALGLPYDRPCPEWTARLEREAGLRRVKGTGRSLTWKIGSTGGRRAVVRAAR